MYGFLSKYASLASFLNKTWDEGAIFINTLEIHPSSLYAIREHWMGRPSELNITCEKKNSGQLENQYFEPNSISMVS